MEQNQNNITKKEDNLFFNCQSGINYSPSEGQTLKKSNNQEIIKEKNIITSDINNNKSLFGNLFDNNKSSLFEKTPNLFGDNHNKTLFGENKNTLFDKDNKEENKFIFDFKKEENIFNDKEINKISLFDNNKPLFENNKSLFGDIPISSEKVKNIFNDNNINLFENKNTSLFEEKDNKKILENDNNKLLSRKKNHFSDSNTKSNEKNSISDKEKEENEDEDDLEEKDNEECEENNDDEEGEEEGNNDNFIARIFKGIKGKEKWYCKKKNVPKPSQKLTENRLLKELDKKTNSEIVSLLHLNQLFTINGDIFYIDTKVLKNGNFFILFLNKFYYIDSKTFKILNVDESVEKYFGLNSEFNYIEEINNELIGIISKEFVLIVQINNKEVKFFQKIDIKANIIKSFPNENLIIINEYEEEKRTNILHYYIYDKNLKYQLKTKEEFDFRQFITNNNNIEIFAHFNCIKNIKKFKNGKIFFFTISTIPLKENEANDSMEMSFSEIDVLLFINIYLYENKELTIIFKKNFTEHCSYYYNILESELGDFLKIWRDENLLINEEEELISFYNINKSSFVIVNIQQKKAKRQKFKCRMKMSFFDKKSQYYYLVRSEEKQEFQEIILCKISPEHGLIPIKEIFLPYFFSDLILTKNGNLLGVAKNTLTTYSFYQHLGRYAPSRIINTSLCLFNIPNIYI